TAKAGPRPESATASGDRKRAGARPEKPARRRAVSGRASRSGGEEAAGIGDTRPDDVRRGLVLSTGGRGRTGAGSLQNPVGAVAEVESVGRKDGAGHGATGDPRCSACRSPVGGGRAGERAENALGIPGTRCRLPRFAAVDVCTV